MRNLVFLFGRHFRERLLRPLRLKPGVPSEKLIASRLHQNLACALAEKHLPICAIPVGDATLSSSGTVVQRVGDGSEPFAPRRFEQPANIGPGEVSQLVEPERDVLDNETVIALRAG